MLFARACELREERLDLEERITEEKKGLDIQRKDLEGMKKKAKSMESQVNSAHSDLQAFQLKKQQRLNELDQVAVLCLHQLLHYQPHGEPPCSIAPCLVFPASALFQLGQRIGELTQEKLHEKKRYKLVLLVMRVVNPLTCISMPSSTTPRVASTGNLCFVKINVVSLWLVQANIRNTEMPNLIVELLVGTCMCNSAEHF